jgi:hypothetical protein
MTASTNQAVTSLKEVTTKLKWRTANMIKEAAMKIDQTNKLKEEIDSWKDSAYNLSFMTKWFKHDISDIKTRHSNDFVHGANVLKEKIDAEGGSTYHDGN